VSLDAKQWRTQRCAVRVLYVARNPNALSESYIRTEVDRLFEKLFKIDRVIAEGRLGLRSPFRRIPSLGCLA
jgi:succinylglutamate desuccinylase